MDLEYTDEFKRAYKKLTDSKPDLTRLIQRKLRLFASNPRHPSLQAGKWEPPNTWYARVNDDIRLFYEVEADVCRLITIGRHDIERSC